MVVLYCMERRKPVRLVFLSYCGMVLVWYQRNGEERKNGRIRIKLLLLVGGSLEEADIFLREGEANDLFW